MHTKQAIAKLKAIFEEDKATEYSPEDVVLNDGPLCRTGVFYTKPGPRGDVLWAGDLGAPDEAFTHAALLDLGLLVDIAYEYQDERELYIYFELGAKGVVTHEICYEHCAGDPESFDPPSSYVSITSLATHRCHFGGECMSLMAALAYGPHTPNMQMAIESLFEKYLFITRECPDTQALVMLEKCLRHDVCLGVPRSAMQYALLYLHGSPEVRKVFERDVALHKALELEGVPALMNDCLARHCFWRGEHAKTSRLLLDVDGLVIAEAMGEEYAIEHFDHDLLERDRVAFDFDDEPNCGLTLTD